MNNGPPKATATDRPNLLTLGLPRRHNWAFFLLPIRRSRRCNSKESHSNDATKAAAVSPPPSELVEGRRGCHCKCQALLLYKVEIAYVLIEYPILA